MNRRNRKLDPIFDALLILAGIGLVGIIILAAVRSAQAGGGDFEPQQQMAEPTRRADDTGISDAAWATLGTIGAAGIALVGTMITVRVHNKRSKTGDTDG